MDREFTKIALALLLACCGCVSVGKLTLQTKPAGADVMRWSEKGKRFVLVGKTPLVYSNQSAANRQAYLYIKIEKKEHAPLFLLIPSAIRGVVLRRVSLKKIAGKPAEGGEQGGTSPAVSQASSDLLRVQSLLMTGEVDAVERALNDLGRRFEQVSGYHILKGNYYILKGRRRSALMAFQTAKYLSGSDDQTTEQIDAAIQVLRQLK